MERAVGVVLRWTGRFFILLGVFILVCSLFLPSAVQPLNSLVCPDGTELDNARYSLPGGPDNARLELVCTSPTYTESAAKQVLLVVASLVALGLVAIYFAERIARPSYQRPDAPRMR